VKSFDAPACVIVKHANPCGVAVAPTRRGLQQGLQDRPDQRLRRHHRLQPRAGRRGGAAGRQAVRRSADGAVFSAEALEIFKGKVNVRLLQIALPPAAPRLGAGPQRLDASASARACCCRRPTTTPEAADLKVVTKLQPTAQQLDDLLFAWTVAKYVKSNAIVFCGGGMTWASAPAR
jgi:phosphoribosylaminoimidazolecarboxamide formyltransferase/IMP cyclohydrolase